MPDEPSAAGGAAPRLRRRTILEGGIFAAALVATASLVALVRTQGYDVPEARAKTLVAVAPWQLVLLEHAARRITASDRPGDASIPTSDAVDVAGFVDAYVAKMPAPLRRDLLRFMGYVEHVAPLGIAALSRFTRLSARDQDRVLASLEASDSELLRGGFAGLKAVVFMGYYRDARTWRILGYEGPLVGRPAAGWER